MEEQLARLVTKVWDKFQQIPPDQRFMIAIAGIPGSGKTTLSQTLTTALNARHATHNPTAPPIAACIPMDGFHLTRAQLSSLPNAAEAHRRRGAAFTFDGAGFLALVRTLRAGPVAPSPAAATVFAPAFSHAAKDPVAAALAIAPTHRLLVFEGNYVCQAREPWSLSAALMDERWFVSVSFPVARARLVRRHVASGVAADEEAAARRADENDLPNGREIVQLLLPVDEVVDSCEDAAWTHE